MFGDGKREHFRMLMRIQENFSGCRVLSYCVVFNRFHILLEVLPMRQGGISDAELLKQLAAAYSDAFVPGGSTGAGTGTVGRGNSCPLYSLDA